MERQWGLAEVGVLSILRDPEHVVKLVNMLRAARDAAFSANRAKYIVSRKIFVLGEGRWRGLTSDDMATGTCYLGQPEP